MNASFETLLNNTKSANDLVAMYRFVKAANEKLQNNIRKAQFMSYQPGRAADADHYFQNVTPAWQATVNEINAFWAAAVAGKPTEEIVSIMTEEREEA